MRVIVCSKTLERISLSLIENDELVHVMRHQTKTQEYQASLVGRRVPVFCDLAAFERILEQGTFNPTFDRTQ